MSIQFPCPGCGKMLAVGEESVGKQAKCPHCELVSLVPETSSTVYEAEAIGGSGEAGQAESGQAEPGSPFGTPEQVIYEPINSRLFDAILITLCCCPPFGIVGIVFAAMCKSEIGAGNYALAKEYSEKAHMWNMIGLGLGVCFWLFFVLLGNCGPGG